MFDELENSVAAKEKFRIAANKLLNQCFLLKKKEDTKKEYTYVRQNKEWFQEFFDLLGYEIYINEDQGVIALKSQFVTGRLQLTKGESIFLLILRLLYIEKRKEISHSYEDVTVLMEEIRERYGVLEIKSQPAMNKSMERKYVSLFKRYNIIKNIDSDVNLADSRIIIYPSVMLAVAVDDINEFYNMTERKLNEYAGGRETVVSEESEQGDIESE